MTNAENKQGVAYPNGSMYKFIELGRHLTG